MQIQNISQFLQYKNLCPFCDKELSLILRVRGDVVSHRFEENPIKKLILNKIVREYSLFTNISIHLSDNKISAEANKSAFAENIQHLANCFNLDFSSIRLNNACRSCPKIYSCRSNVLNIENVKITLKNNVEEILILETTYDDNIKLTEEFAIIEGDSGYCTHFIYDPFEEKSIISWGKNAKDANGYKRYKIDKEIHLDGLKYNFTDPEKILKKAINLTALK